MAHEPSEIFKALSVPSRIHILSLLKAHGPMPVKDIAEAVGMSSPAISQHLKILKHAGLVDAQRDGYWVPYAVNAAALHDCCGHLIQVCACPHCDGHQEDQPGDSQTEVLLHKREQLLVELQRVENELEKLR
ncbi:metalloregulator ArsR/SmtB family transcription factor [Candidatus Bipolaricaulota bacterium]|nr:metalloregulator ArsR/SmtB family transcription factor [Candidatus Bipolaricaulota bacterium]